MQRHDDHPPRIDIETEDGEDYATMALAEPIARQAQILTDAEQAPQTLGELANLFARRQAFQASQAADLEKLLVTDESPHEVHLAEQTANTYCFLDALALGLLQEAPVDITTLPPGDEDAIEFTVHEQGIQAGHEDMIVSFGFSKDMPTDPAAFEDASDPERLAIMHEQGCPKMNLFASLEAYEAWDEQAEAITTPIGLPQALAMVHAFTDGWQV